VIPVLRFDERSGVAERWFKKIASLTGSHLRVLMGLAACCCPKSCGALLR
jgi:hypothetical protein